MSLPVAALAGIMPMLIYPVFVYWMDRFEKEPLILISASFLWGFVPAAILSLITQLLIGVPFLLLDGSGALADAVVGLVVAPFTEEIFKGAALLMIFFIWRTEFDGVFDGIIYGSLVGFGFAAIENVLYFLDADTTLFFTRAVLFGLNHAFYTSLTGIGFGVARHAPSRIVRFLAPAGGLMLAIGMHAFHNATLTLGGESPAVICLAIFGDWLGIFFVLAVMIFAIRRERRWITDELRDEVGLALTAEQYAVVASPLGRATAQLNALATGGLRLARQESRFFHTLTELAYKKHARRQRGDAGTPLERIETLRARAAAESVELGEMR